MLVLPLSSNMHEDCLLCTHFEAEAVLNLQYFIYAQ